MEDLPDVRPKTEIKDLAPGDRFIAGGDLWTYLGMLVARKHSSESLSLKGRGLGCDEDPLCPFMAEDQVEFVAPGDEGLLRWALGWVSSAVLGRGPSKPSPARIAQIAQMALAGSDPRQALREAATAVPPSHGPAPDHCAHPVADALAALAKGNPAGEDIGQLAEKVARLEQANGALAEIERRLRENTGPIRDLIEAHPDTPNRREILEAWKWAVYGAAVHAQAFIVTPPEAGQ